MDYEVLATPPKKVAVVRALRGLGDFLCTVPALRALRSALPQAFITYVGLPSVGPLVRRFPEYIDELLEFPGFPGIPELPVDTRRTSSFLATVQGRFDLALQMHGSGTNSNAFTLMLGAGQSAGFYLPALGCPDPRTFFPYPAHCHEIHRWILLLEELGIEPRGDTMEFPVHDADRQRLHQAWPEHGEKEYVCLHAGAFEPARRWPPARFAQVANFLALAGYEIVLTGTPDESEVSAAVAAHMDGTPTNLTGRTDLGGLAALLEGASLVICNDTGVSHLTAAIGTPSVVIFSASDPQRWAPLDRARHRRVGEVMPERANACRHCQDVKGHRCLGDACKSLRIEPSGDWRPAEVDAVLEAAQELLNSRVGR